jgi:beta-galactosidase
MTPNQITAIALATALGVACTFATPTPPPNWGEIVITEVRSATISLDGMWKFNAAPPPDFWRNEVDASAWQDMPVPGDIWAQGVAFTYDQPVAYKHRVEIPADFAGQRVILHFDAVHNLATVWVNGAEVATHQGGFTPWECDITDYVTPGEPAWLALRVTDLKREISFNGKAQRPIGGITRSVQLRARPATFFHLPVVSTPFDADFVNATLQVVGRVTRPMVGAQATFRIFEPSGREVPLSPATVQLDSDVVTFQAPVSRPIQWDAEHPNLYRLEITITGTDQATATYSLRIGFRDLRFDERHNLLVNGRIVKLRGANRHLTNPTGGKVPTREHERLDTELAKDANMNFFRTSHYPPGVGLLEQCDELGIYVTVESAIVDTGKDIRPSKGMQDDPEATRHFLSQLEEMVLHYGSHPSVIIWSTANESVYGSNFLKSYQLCRQLDPSRPVIASYQIKYDVNHESYDILSKHYPEWNSDFSKVTMPTFYDEWIHALGHGAHEWFHDPSGRDYWGRSLDLTWTNLFPAHGSIGGAIWNFIDDVTYLPDPTIQLETHRSPRRFIKPGDVRTYTPVPRGNVFGVARWGIIDEWRRKKPEFWNTKKAYSPVRLLTRQVTDFQSGEPLRLRVHNRFDHANLSEIDLRLTYDSVTTTVACDAVESHAQGYLTIPPHAWRNEATLKLEFIDRSGRILDTEVVSIGTPKPIAIAAATAGARLAEAAGMLRVECDQMAYVINPRSGLFEAIEMNGNRHSMGGPYLHLYQAEEYFQKAPEDNQTRGNIVAYDGPDLDTWVLETISTEQNDGIVRVQVAGHYGTVRAHYGYTIGSNGRLDVDYRFSGIPTLATPNKMRDRGGPLTLEAGIKFRVSDTFERLSWSRQGYWSYYPADHLGALTGSVPLFSTAKPAYRQHPNQPWELDVHDWFYQGVDVPPGKLMSNIARGAKHGIHAYTLSAYNPREALTVLGDGARVAARFDRAADGAYYLYILDTIDYRLRWGNYSLEQRPASEHAGIARLHAASAQ